MARIDTDKTINPTQLGIELGRAPVRYVVGRYVDVEGVGEANLRAAVEAHVADPAYVDPEWVEPESLPTYAELVAEVKGIKDRAAQAAAGLTGGAATVGNAVAGPRS